MTVVLSSLWFLDPVTSSRTATAGTLRLTAWTFVAALVGQGALGWLLAEDDFGTYAVAIGIVALVFAVGDGGVGRFLVDRGRYASPNVHANAVWYSASVALLIGILMALLAPLGDWLFDESTVSSVLLIAAAGVPLGFFAPVAQALMRSHGDERAAELLEVLTVVAYFGLVALFASLEFDAASFVLPVLVINPLLSLAGWAMVRRMRIPFGRASSRGVVRILHRSRPLLILSAATGLLRHGQFAAFGLAAPIETVGWYYFAYRLAVGSVLWLAAPVRWFLVPIFASMRGDPWRRRRAALDSFLVASLLIGTVPLLLAALAEPIEAVVWRGRWEEAVFSIQVLGVVAAVEVVVVVALMLFEADSAAHAWGGLLAWRGAGLVVVVGLAGWLADSVDTVALVAGGYLVVGGVLITIHVLAALRLERSKVGRAVAAVYLLTGGATVASWLVQTALGDAFSWLRLSTAGAVFLLVVVVGARTFFESRLRRAAGVIERTTGNTLLQKTLRRAPFAQRNPVA